MKLTDLQDRLVGDWSGPSSLFLGWLSNPRHDSGSRLRIAPVAKGMLGSYPAPPDPDWSWRITLELKADGLLMLLMHNITPKGEEDLAVKAEYRR